MTGAVIDDLMHRASTDESFLMRFRRDPEETLGEFEATPELSDEEYEALVEQDENAIQEKLTGLRTDLLVAVAVTVVVVSK